MDPGAGDWEVERELTYDVAPADTPAVHEVLAPPAGGLRIGHEAVRVRARSAGAVLHVYTRDAWDDRCRVLIELTGRRRIRVSEKRWAADAGDDPVKLDRRRRVSGAEAWAELAGRWRVAFIKFRYPLELTLAEQAAVLLARIDVMSPVDAHGEPRPERLFANVEVEARSAGADPAVVERDRDLWASLGPVLTPATRPKVDVAAGEEPPPVWSAPETAARVRALTAALPDLTDRSPMAELAALHAAARFRSTR
jgi:hypothetical protein